MFGEVSVPSKALILILPWPSGHLVGCDWTDKETNTKFFSVAPGPGLRFQPADAREIGTQLWILQGITGIKITKTGGRCSGKKERNMTPKACFLTWGCYSLSSSSWPRLQVEQSPAASCRQGSTKCCSSCCSGNLSSCKAESSGGGVVNYLYGRDTAANLAAIRE